MVKPKALTVTQVTGYIRRLLESDAVLSMLWITGEISNFKSHSSGHYYFTLKDANSALFCVMFASSSQSLPFLPENGMSVIMAGHVSFFEKTGRLQFYGEYMEPVGIGAYQQGFLQLKEKLEQEGLFDEAFKRPIAPFPRRIVVITSPTGAVVRDIIQIMNRRNPAVSIIVYPVLVQGEQAADDIVRAFHIANDRKDGETIILGRGGGSMEDLWVFNEEKVARAIFASEIPVISAVGHETDFTIADFVADLRAPTPSAAAELAAKSRQDFYFELNHWLQAMGSGLAKNLSYLEQRLQDGRMRIARFQPDQRIEQKEKERQACLSRICRAMQYALTGKEQRFQMAVNQLAGVSPLAILQRGYAIAQLETGECIQRIDQVQIEEEINLTVSDGCLQAVIKGKERGHGKEENV